MSLCLIYHLHGFEPFYFSCGLIVHPHLNRILLDACPCSSGQCRSILFSHQFLDDKAFFPCKNELRLIIYLGVQEGFVNLDGHLIRLTSQFLYHGSHLIPVIVYGLDAVNVVAVSGLIAVIVEDIAPAFALL